MQNYESWRDLCRAAVEAKTSDELLQIVERLTRALEQEGRVPQATNPISERQTNVAPNSRAS